MYIRIIRDGTRKKLAMRSKARIGIELEAFGPRSLEPREIYSKHNLELKYETRNAAAIVAGRLATAIDYGFRSEDGPMSEEDKSTMLTLDYMDALFGTYRIRTLYGVQNERYMSILNSEWTLENVLANEWLSRAAPNMFRNFLNTMSTCKLWLKKAIEEDTPKFLQLWAGDLLTQIDRDTEFYQALKSNFEECIQGKLAAL